MTLQSTKPWHLRLLDRLRSQWLLMGTAWALGVITVPALNRIGVDPTSLLHDLVPESVGILFTVLFLERLADKREALREREEIRQRLIRELGSRDNATSRRAAREAHERDMFTDGSLREAHLSEAQMEEVDLSGADLRGTRLWESDLSRARLTRCNMENASLERAELDRSFLFQANLTHAFLEGANLSQAILDEANLAEAHLREANLQGASLRMADLKGAFLLRANLTNAYLDDAQFDEHTVLPDAQIIGRSASLEPIYDKVWNKDVNMERYTDPNYWDYWRPPYLKPEFNGRKPYWLGEPEWS